MKKPLADEIARIADKLTREELSDERHNPSVFWPTEDILCVKFVLVSDSAYEVMERLIRLGMSPDGLNHITSEITLRYEE